jgi:hypothetical protein
LINWSRGHIHRLWRWHIDVGRFNNAAAQQHGGPYNNFFQHVLLGKVVSRLNIQRLLQIEQVANAVLTEYE